MVFDIPEDTLTYFISERSGQGHEHRFRKGDAHEFFYNGLVVTQERAQVLNLGTEAQFNCQFEKKAYVKIAEIRLHGIQQKHLPFAPFIKPRLGYTFLHNTIEHLAEEHRHGVLVEIVADAHQGAAYRKIPDRKQTGLAGIRDISLENIQRQKQRHHLLVHGTDDKALSSIFLAQSMKDYGILTELSSVKKYQGRAACHIYLRL